MSLALTPSLGPAAASAAQPSFTATLQAGLDPSLDGLARQCATTAFQRRAWLESWFATIGMAAGQEPFTLLVRSGATGPLALAMVLTRQRRRGLTIWSMPDGGVTDYCAPILGPGAPLDDAGARALCRAVQEALSADGLAGDVLRFDKMPVMLDGRANPLLAGFATRPSRLAGNVVSVPGTWQQWLAALDRPVRKEIGRCRRLFEGKGGRFLVAATPAEAAPIMDALETLQAERIHGQGLDYILDEPANRAHYRQLVNAGLADGSAVLGALVHGEGAAAEVVAALLAITHRDGCCMVRLAQAGGAWRTLSPGRQVLERTMEHLHGQGFRRFDFTIGSYDYKRRLGAVPQPLVDVRHGLSWPGRAVMAAGAALHGMREAARKQEWLRAVARRFRGGR